MRIIIGCLITLLAVATPVMADFVAYWKPSVSAENRTSESIEGEIKSWSWKGGVAIADFTGKSTTIARTDLIRAERNDDQRDATLADALATGDRKTLETIAKGGKNELDKEEALFELAALAAANDPVPSATAALEKYNATYPDGHFLNQSLKMLASIQTSANKPDDAAKTLEIMATLGDTEKAYAYVQLGMMLFNNGKKGDASAKFEAAVASARKVRDTSLEMRALGWGGEAARQDGRADAAKQMFEDALKVDVRFGFDSDAAIARGVVYKGLGDIAGNTKAAYDRYRVASYWLEGHDFEKHCVKRMMEISEALSSTDAQSKQWADRAKKLRSVIQAKWPQLLTNEKK